MKRLLIIVATVCLGLLAAAPAVLADEPSLPHTGRVLISTGGDITIPAGEHADAVVVIDGAALISGEVNTIVVIGGSAELTGATTESVVAIGSPVTLGTGTSVLDDVLTLDAAVTQAPGVVVQGAVRDLAPVIASIGFVVGPALLLLYVGFALAAIAAALLLAGLAARQVRAAEALMREETFGVIAAGALGLVVPVLLIVLLAVTIVGAPLAVGIAIGLWPLAAFVGYLVAGIAIGDWIVGRMSPGVDRDRPYLAAVIGVLVLQVIGLLPIVGAIASFIGFGAVLLLAWRVFRGGSSGTVPTVRHVPSPVAG
jgi:hypothetical protein